MHKKILFPFGLMVLLSIFASTRAASIPPTPTTTGPASGVVGGLYRYTITLYPSTGGCRKDVVFDAGTGIYSSRGPYVIPAGGSTQTQFDTSWSKPGTYSVRAQEQDACAGNSGWSSTIVVTITADTTPPTAPDFYYGGAQSTSQIDLTFGNSVDNAYVAGYKVYRNGTFLANATGRTSDSDGHSWGTYSDTGLSPGTTYNYTFAAYDVAGNLSQKSTPVSLTTYSPPDVTAPSKPANLSATAMSSSQINLNWDPSTDNVGVAGYKIYRNGEYATDITFASFPDTYIAADTTYSYTVAAYDAAGNTSPQSNSASAKTPPAPDNSPPAPPQDTEPPAAPTGLTVGSIGTTQINLSWNAATDNVGAVGYRIYRDDVFIDTTVNTYYNDHNQYLPDYYTVLPPATTYRYAIAAYDAAQNLSPQSNTVSAKTLSDTVTPNDTNDTNPPSTDTTGTSPPVPPAPTFTSNSGVVGKSYTFSTKLFPDPDGGQEYAVFDWGDGVNVETSDNSSDLVTPVTAGTSVSVSHTWSTKGTYTVKVMAVDSTGLASNWSPSVTMMIKVASDDEKIVPSTPTGLSAKVISSSQIDLSWTASTDNTGVVGYKIFRGDIIAGSSATPSYSDIGLTAGTSYSYTIVAYDDAGNVSLKSDSASAKTLDVEIPKDKDKEKTINKDKITIDKDQVQITTDQDSQYFTRNLKFGSRGDDVKALQQILIDEGAYPKGLDAKKLVNGYFGRATKTAVIKFQKKYKSELKKANGKIGTLERAKLNMLYKGKVSTGPVISSFSPSSGIVGSLFTITGSGFTPTGNKVKFGDLGTENNLSNSYVSADGTTITFSVPYGSYLACWSSKPACGAPAYSTQPGIYDVSVINANGVSSAKAFTVTR